MDTHTISSQRVDLLARQGKPNHVCLDMAPLVLEKVVSFKEHGEGERSNKVSKGLFGFIFVFLSCFFFLKNKKKTKNFLVPLFMF